MRYSGRSGILGAGEARWFGFQAGHIFPLAYEGHWKDVKYGSWITIQADTGGSVNSIQNGKLLDATIHPLFDNCARSINPDI
jgi:hypothetical protein